MDKESNWLWFVYVVYFAILYWLGAIHFHCKQTVIYYVIFLVMAFLVAPVFKFFWSIDKRRRK